MLLLLLDALYGTSTSLNEIQNIVVVAAGITAHNEDNEVLMRMNSSPDPGCWRWLETSGQSLVR